MTAAPSAIIAGLRIRGIHIFAIGGRIAAGPSHRLEDVDRFMIRFAKAALLEALRPDAR